MFDIIIVGAGIIGLATSLKILEKNPNLKLLILEKENDICQHQTGNNSGVIHSGIYYKPGSLKALNCIRGYKMLIDFCNRNEVNYKITGKIIVATLEEEIPILNNIYERGLQNGLDGLKKLNLNQMKEIEPYVNGIAGIFVPQTGIVDYFEVSKKYLELILKHNCEIKFNHTVIDIKINTDFCEVITDNESFNSKVVVTCAGLQSDRIAKMTHPDLPLRIIPFRGEYYKLKNEKTYLVNSLIYPVPNPEFPFLGVHFTRMINDDVEAGPNAVLALKREGYSKTSFNLRDAIDTFTWKGFYKIVRKNWKIGLYEYYRSFSKKAFVNALQKLIPEIQEEDLIAGGAGVRAQACSKDGGLLDDFYIVEDKRAIHVCNAPSPAATASLSIGDYISEKVMQQI
ncbi:MAG: L-2-hydroxyglutarate oxidase [Melioribacter sp.]|uniref:L-2-hydroxyglutarate oxidase n=1 Tax=Rosettibacter primus TaxID=3111523 RepID=UPI00247BB87F|nr:L-2-hydroxyglutarate oxidase [Melioribacter sp.]